MKILLEKAIIKINKIRIKRKYNISLATTMIVLIRKPVV